MVAYVTVNGQTVLSGSRMTIIAGVFSVCAILCYLLCFHLVRERVDVPANNSKMDIGKMLKSVFTNRALLGIIAAALFLLLAMLTMQGMAGYVFPNFYGSAAAQSTASLLSSVLILLVCAPFASSWPAGSVKRAGHRILHRGHGAGDHLLCSQAHQCLGLCRLLLCRLHLPGLLQHHHLGNDHRCHR